MKQNPVFAVSENRVGLPTFSFSMFSNTKVLGYHRTTEISLGFLSKLTSFLIMALASKKCNCKKYLELFLKDVQDLSLLGIYFQSFLHK